MSAGENVSATEVVPNGVDFVELKFLIAHWLLCRQGMDWVTCTFIFRYTCSDQYTAIY